MVTIKAQSVDRVLTNLKNVQKQVRFAISLAANETAKEIQAFTLNDLLPEKFTLRSRGAPWQKPGTKYGFNVKFATKQTLTAVIGSQADWLKLQEEGGTKQVQGHRVAVPTLFWKKREEIMEAAKKPKALLKDLTQLQRRIERAKQELVNHKGSQRSAIAKERHLNSLTKRAEALTSLAHAPFIAKMKSGKEGIFIRTDKERHPLKMLFSLEQQTTIAPRLEFEKQGEQIVERIWEQKFTAAFVRAMATAK